MPKMTLSVPHTLGQAGAAERLKTFLDKVRERYQGQVSNLQENWTGNTLTFGFTTYGFGIKGALNVAETEVKVDGEIPFAAMMFKGKIEQEVRAALEKALRA